MFKRKAQDGVVYTDIGSISGTSLRAKRKRKKEAKKAKAQMKANRKEARQKKTAQAENGIILLTIAALVAGAALVVWQAVEEAKVQSAAETQPAEEE